MIALKNKQHSKDDGRFKQEIVLMTFRMSMQCSFKLTSHLLYKIDIGEILI